MILAIAKQEFTGLCRDGRYRLTVALLLVLILASTAFGWANYRDLIEQAEHAAEHDYQRWRNQDPTHPHNAAHYGSYAFKSSRPLTIIDSGIEPYLGSAILYAAHQPSEMEFPPAQDATALQRFGDMGIAETTRVLLPLLAILISFSAFAGEREQGTLRQLLSLGVKPTSLLWGKILGITLALTVVLLPAGLLGLLAAALLSPVSYRLDEIQRAGGLGLLYALYLGIFLFLSLAISARCRTARNALTLLLVFWVATVFALPRALLDLSATLQPAPASNFQKAYAEELSKQSEAHIDEVLNKLTKQYNVKSPFELPFDFVGVYMKAADEGGYPVIDAYINKRFDVYRQQSNIMALGSVLSPATGLYLASMALAGNDLEQHRDFVLKVEHQRRILNDTMTAYMIEHSQKRADGNELEGDTHLWAKVPPFIYAPPGWQAAISPYLIPLSILATWFLAALGFAFNSVRQLKII